ncbi:MAG: thermonuclease family protein [Gammaproteobacteria bacterium]|nr:thermonuclease family protein [Gammaproteobacteria bacterium]
MADAEEVRVRWVPDGDTVRLTDDRWVRLAGIDTPETGVRDGRPEYFAAEARTRLQVLTLGRSLTLESSSTDRYGRVVGWLYDDNSQLLNEMLVAEGFATFYHHAGNDESLQQRLLQAQHRAMDAQIGFWPRILAIPAPPGGWIGNRRSRRFHHPEGPHASQIAARNRVVFKTTEEAFRAGHAPARGGFPWPEAHGALQ